MKAAASACPAGRARSGCWRSSTRIVDRRGKHWRTSTCSRSFPDTITDTALCGLGQAACNPVVSTLKYFRNEYLAHVVDHHCPQSATARKRRLVIKPELCKGCGKCKRNCPMEAISGEIQYAASSIDNEKCIHCGACWGACPFGAIDAIEEEG